MMNRNVKPRKENSNFFALAGFVLAALGFVAIGFGLGRGFVGLGLGLGLGLGFGLAAFELLEIERRNFLSDF